MLCRTEARETPCKNLGGRKNAKIEPTMHFRDSRIAAVQSVPWAGIKQRVASVVTHWHGLVTTWDFSCTLSSCRTWSLIQSNVLGFVH